MPLEKTSLNQQREESPNSRLRVAIAGLGSNTSATLQILHLAHSTNPTPTGIMYESIGGYTLADIELVAAFDIDRQKVYSDLADAIHAKTTAAKVHVEIPPTSIIVDAGLQLDGLGPSLSQIIVPHEDCGSVTLSDISRRLRETSSDVLLCNLPAGAKEAVRAYAKASADAGAAFVNATPELVANDPDLAETFQNAGVPLLGDDLRSHIGATTLHTALLELLESRAIQVDGTYQLNIGGNTDFLNLSDPGRSRSKQKSKRAALSDAGIPSLEVNAGPSGYAPYLGDTKVGYLRIEGRSILDSQVSLRVELEVEDSPNAAGVIVNALRVAKAAKDRGIAGVVDSVCPFLFKSARKGATESAGLRMFRRFIEESEREEC